MKLVIEDAEGTRSVVAFAEEEVTVGRAPEGNTFRMGDRDVSRRHARFFRSGGAIWVEDLGSLTGTRVNGERISGRRRLREGDLVEIGAYDLALLPEVEVSGPGAPPPIPHGARTPDPTATRRTPDPTAARRTPDPTAPPPAAAPAGRPTPPIAPAPAPAPAPVVAPAPLAPAPAPAHPAPRPALAAAPVAAPAPATMPAAPSVNAAARPPSRTGRTVALAIVAGALALALGLAAGWAVGSLGAPAPARAPAPVADR